MMLLCCSLASSSFTLRKSLFLSDDRLNSRMYSVRSFLLITTPSALASDSKNDFHKTLSGRNHSVPYCALSQQSFFRCLLPFPSASLCCISAYNLPPATTRPTQSIMYVPLQVNRFPKSILLIVQYKYLKSCSGDFYSPESDPPHKIMRYWFYYSI